MSGGIEEYVMAVMLKEDGTLSYSLSGFNNNNNNNIVQSMYYDLYEYRENPVDYTRSKLGDATCEVSKWKSEFATFLYSSYSRFKRGVRVNSGLGSFSFASYNGVETQGGYGNVLGSRAVLILD